MNQDFIRGNTWVSEIGREPEKKMEANLILSEKESKKKLVEVY